MMLPTRQSGEARPDGHLAKHMHTMVHEIIIGNNIKVDTLGFRRLPDVGVSPL